MDRADRLALLRALDEDHNGLLPIRQWAMTHLIWAEKILTTDSTRRVFSGINWENKKGTSMSGVSEYVILSGPVVHDSLVRMRAELRSYLASYFPNCRFSLAVRESEGMDFVVVPVVGSTGDDVELEIPDLVVLAEIKMALEAFAPGQTLH